MNVPRGVGVLSEVVARGYCAGCGVCAAVCPSQTLQMRFNGFGEYGPVACTGGSCRSHCGVCLSVCPFSASACRENEMGRDLFGGTETIQHDSRVGYYLAAFAGFSQVHDHRVNGAAGGLTTWTLEALFQAGRIDRALCVAPTAGEATLFRAVVCRGPEDVRRCSKSCYYPIEFSGVLREVLATEGRYAVVALPCVAKALRLAALWNKTLSTRIRYILGLVCGQARSAFFSEGVCALAGGEPSHLRSMEFRVKDSHRPASDHAIRLEWQRGDGDGGTRVLSWSDGPGRMWSRGYFTLNACHYCDDVFAELADASFMDAWLPEYVSDPRGTNLVVVRHPGLRAILEDGARSGVISLRRVPVDSVVASQRVALRAKREDLAVRLYLAKRSHLWTPPKRIPAQKRPALRSIVRVWLNLRCSRASRVAFAEQKKAGWNSKGFSRRIRLWRILEWILQRADSLASRLRRLRRHRLGVAR
jgi:coenzyme F420 hydrogenase subunit beta